MVRVTRLDHFVLRVRDVDRSIAFYGDILGLPIEALDDYRAGRRPFVSARVGDQLIDLVPDPTYDGNAGGILHFCVEVDADLATLLPQLKDRGVNIIEEQPMARLGARGFGLAAYIMDPDGYVVELKEPSR